MSGARPNLLLIGAQKAGTTLLHSLLATQPGVSMSEPKELDFFTSELGSWRRGLGWYEGHFDAGAVVRGESSPSYTAFPFAEGVPERIAATLEDVRLVYIVRDPVERAISAIRHRIGEGYERRSPAEVLADPGLEASAYVAMSRYAMQLERFDRVLGDSATLIVPFEGLIVDPGAVVTAVLRHCGHEAPIALPAGERNAAAAWPLRRALRRLLPEPVVRRLLSAPPLRRLDHRLMRPLGQVEPGAEGRERLASLLADDAARFRQRSGQKLEGWSV